MSLHHDERGEWWAGERQPWDSPERVEDTRQPWLPPAQAAAPLPLELICPRCLWEGPGDSCDMCGEPLVTLAEHAEASR